MVRKTGWKFCLEEDGSGGVRRSRNGCRKVGSGEGKESKKRCERV